VEKSKSAVRRLFQVGVTKLSTLSVGCRHGRVQLACFTAK